MRRNYVSFVALTLLAAGFAVSAAPQTAVSQEVKDHPLLSRYPGSEIHRLYPSSVKQFDEIALPMGPYEKGKFTKAGRLEGKVKIGRASCRERV